VIKQAGHCRARLGNNGSSQPLPNQAGQRIKSTCPTPASSSSPIARLRLEIALRGSDVDRVAGTKVFDAQSGLVDAARLAASTAAIAAYVTTPRRRSRRRRHTLQGQQCRNCSRPGRRHGPPDLVRVMKSRATLIYRSMVLIDVDPRRQAGRAHRARAEMQRRLCWTRRKPKSKSRRRLRHCST